MKKRISLLLTFVLVLALLAGCAGTPVIYYSDCTCPAGSHNTPDVPDTPAVTDGAVKTGLYITTSLDGTMNAAADANGQAKYDVTLVAVTVTDDGVIESCLIDSIPATVYFDASGAVVTELMTDVQTKNELGDAYGMVAYGGAKYEWNEQVAALARYAEGKTGEQLKAGAVNESSKAADADRASVATIRIGGYVSAIEAAVANARLLGAQAGDELRLATLANVTNSVSATAEKNGTAQLDADVTALTVNNGVITSCVIDSLQAKVEFDAAGAVTTDLTAAVQTKNELGEGYGMKAWGGAKFEWNEQAASFAAYVTGKTAAEVAGIAVNETAKPTDADLSASVTISVGGFQALIAKAMQ